MRSLPTSQCFVGEAKVFRDKIYQSDGATPQDVTGWSYTFVVHAYGDPSTVFITKSTGGFGITPSNPTATPPVSYNWAFDTAIVAADTAGMFPNQYEYYFYRTDDPNQAEPTRGLFTLLQK